MIVRATEVWNKLQLNGTILPRGKKTRNLAIKKAIIQKYGMSHKNKN